MPSLEQRIKELEQRRHAALADSDMRVVVHSEPGPSVENAINVWVGIGPPGWPGPLLSEQDG